MQDSSHTEDRLRSEIPRSVTWDDHDESRQPRVRHKETEYLSGTDHGRLNETAHAFVESQLGFDRYKELKCIRELFEMIESACVAFLEDAGS